MTFKAWYLVPEVRSQSRVNCRSTRVVRGARDTFMSHMLRDLTQYLGVSCLTCVFFVPKSRVVSLLSL